MKNMFPGKDNYSVSIKISPSVHGYIGVSSITCENNGKKAYRVNRTLEYAAAFGPMRDRMLAGLFSVYASIFKELGGKSSDAAGKLKNYYVVAVATDHDLKDKILYFDMYPLQADSYESLIKSKEFLAIPHIDEDGVHSAIFNLGYQYIKDMDGIGINTTMWHMCCFKENHDGIRTYEINNGTFDMDTDATKNLINEALSNNDIHTYHIGMVKDRVDLSKLAEELINNLSKEETTNGNG